MIDFSSALYLGMKHPWEEIDPWDAYTVGKPSVLENPIGYSEACTQAASLLSCESAILFRSTLHVFSDLHAFINAQSDILIYDSLLYPVGFWGIERCMYYGITAIPFEHFSSVSLERTLTTFAGRIKRPVLVTDGWCPQCNKGAPLKIYEQLLKPLGGMIIIDDTQALGLYGTKGGKTPYGSGGGGMKAYTEMFGIPHVITGSFAKAFGVPVAVAGSNDNIISLLKKRSRTLESCSPPSTTDIKALYNALLINKSTGDKLRERLFRNILLFKETLAKSGIETEKGYFPVQTLRCNRETTTLIHNRLELQDIRTLLMRSHCSKKPVLSFIIRTDHTENEILETVTCILETIGATKIGKRRITYDNKRSLPLPSRRFDIC